ncbi:MAG: topoisomerase [Ilumatobacteraceae bacterium]|nr:topoisomerase [Ilumatobacteraceae bacterium]
MDSTLRYGSDQEPGIRRRGQQRISYVDDTTGRPVDAETVARIRSIAIPPAWTDVWIARDPASHILATGRDAKGRKQYRYHPDFTVDQADTKFADLVTFGTSLGSLRRRVAHDLAATGIGHDRVVATVVRMLDVTSLRIGNVQYSKDNDSYGLTTLRNDHVAVRGAAIHLEFRGKSGHDFDVRVVNRRLAAIIASCQHLPGQSLFEYRSEDGELRPVGSNDVNAYLAEHAGAGATAKTFRTWNATVRAASGLAQRAATGEPPTARAVNLVIQDVADHLGNTRSVCRNSYVHPAVIESFTDGTLARRWERPVASRPAGLHVDERRTLRFLRQRR